MMTNNPLTYWRDKWCELTLIERITLAAFLVMVVIIVLVSPALAQVMPTNVFIPIDLVALLNVVLAFLTAVFTGFVSVYVVTVGAKIKRAELAAVANTIAITKVSDTVALVERNTNSISTRNEEIAKRLGIEEGIKKQKIVGDELAKILLDGQKQGAETERASVAASAAAPVVKP